VVQDLLVVTVQRLAVVVVAVLVVQVFRAMLQAMHLQVELE
jgi:hypothetical protein